MLAVHPVRSSALSDPSSAVAAPFSDGGASSDFAALLLGAASARPAASVVTETAPEDDDRAAADDGEMARDEETPDGDAAATWAAFALFAPPADPRQPPGPQALAFGPGETAWRQSDADAVREGAAGEGGARETDCFAPPPPVVSSPAVNAPFEAPGPDPQGASVRAVEASVEAGDAGEVNRSVSALSSRQAQIAGGPEARATVLVDDVVFCDNNNKQLLDKECEAEVDGRVGIDVAREGETMRFAAPSSPVAFDPRPAASAAVVEGAPAPESAALRMIERVAEAADQVKAGAAGRVTVRIDLDDTKPVEVTVALREGRVHADFRCDSPELRTALASAWETFTRGREAADHRWAEPVFATASGRVEASSPSAGAEERSSGSGSFGEDRGGRREASGAAVAAPPFYSARRGVRPMSEPSAARHDSAIDHARLLSVQA